MTTHASHPPTPGTTPTEQPRDPVCGMRLSPKTAADAVKLHGQTYYFCATGCREKFEKKNK